MNAKKKLEKKSQKKLPKDSLPNIKVEDLKKTSSLLPKNITPKPAIEQQILSQLPPAFQNMPGVKERLQKQLEKLPKEKLMSIAVQQTSVQQISSPYPPPIILDGLEKHCSGATDRVLTIVENQQKQQSKLSDAQIRKIDIEANVLQKESSTARITVISQVISNSFVIVLCFMALGAAIWFAATDKTSGAITFGAAAIITALSKLFWGYENKSKK